MERKRTIDSLIFAYNADTGKLRVLLDGAKKLLMLNGCALCKITHGITGEKDEWKSCKEEIGIPVEYLHRDELDPELKNLTQGQLPCVVAVTGTEKIVLLTREVIARCRGNVNDLRARLSYYAATKHFELVAPRQKTA